MVAYSTDGRAMIFSSAQLTPKTTRATQGMAVLTLRKKSTLDRAVRLAESGITNQARYKWQGPPGGRSRPADGGPGGKANNMEHGMTDLTRKASERKGSEYIEKILVPVEVAAHGSGWLRHFFPGF